MIKLHHFNLKLGASDDYNADDSDYDNNDMDNLFINTPFNDKIKWKPYCHFIIFIDCV